MLKINTVLLYFITYLIFEKKTEIKYLFVKKTLNIFQYVYILRIINY